MLYHYLASDRTGKILEGELDAGNVGEILEYLGGKELRPVSVDAISPQKKLSSFFSKISIEDKVFLTKYMSLMLKVGTDLLSAVDILIADFQKPAVKGLLLEIRENLTQGQPFHLAFEKHPKDFDPVFISLLKAAESSGNLQETFVNLSTSLEKESQLRSKVRSALIYPVIILAASLAIFIFLSTFALPKIANVFMQSGINPPFFSQIVFTVGLFFGAHVFLILSLILVLAAVGYWFFGRNPVGRRIWQEVVNHIPVLHQIQRDLAIQRFAATFSSLMRAGLPIVESLHLTADVVSTEEFKNSLVRVADEGLARGLTVGEAFRRETVFPKVISNLIAISEKAGHLDEILKTIADFYADNVDTSIKSLISVLEPLLLFGMGALVGLIALSIIVPIYQLTSQF